MEPVASSLEKRIEHLERAARVHRLVIAVMLIVGLGGAAFVSWRPRSTQVQTRQLSIVDEKGRARLQLGSFGDEVYGLSLSDGAGKARALLEVQRDGNGSVFKAPAE